MTTKKREGARMVKAGMRGEEMKKECVDRRREIYYRQQKVEGGRSYGQ